MAELTVRGVAWRVTFALALVFATYNPSGVSYLHWLAEGFPQVPPVKAVVGVGLLGLWFFFVRSAHSSLGSIGVGLLVALFSAVVWWMSSRGWISIGRGPAIVWIALAILGLVLGIGMSWALIRQKASGQASVDRVDT
jgi:hypothetical protein